MSQLINAIRVSRLNSYLFKIALDHAPEQGEYEAIEQQIQAAMERLGVPAEQVSVFPMMSSMQPSADTPQEEEKPKTGGRYLLCIMVRTEEGGFTEEPAEVAERATLAFAKYAGAKPENVAAVVLENAYLEVESRQSKSPMTREALLASGAAKPRRI